MKKFHILMFVLTLLLSACQLEPKTLSELYTGDLKDVAKIAIVGESTGFGKEVTNKETLVNFLMKLKIPSLLLRKTKNKEKALIIPLAYLKIMKKPFNLNQHQIYIPS